MVQEDPIELEEMMACSRRSKPSWRGLTDLYKLYKSTNAQDQSTSNRLGHIQKQKHRGSIIQ